MPRGPGRRRPRALCPLAPLAVSCHAYGAEHACGLCALIDFAHPVTQLALGLPGEPDNFDRAEREVVAQVDRCMRAGWTPRRGTMLHGVAQDHGLFAARTERLVAARKAAAADDPPPF